MRIITGCPRSGTSFVCQIALTLGANFGNESELISGNQWNQNGYFENKKINEINHRLLFGRWSNPNIWIDKIWEDNFSSYYRKIASMLLAPVVCRESNIAARSQKFHDEIQTHADQSIGITIKDPRFCYVLPAWIPTGQVESILFVMRHPWEIANSLSRQTGLPKWLTYRAYNDAIDRFLNFANDIDFTIVNFNAFQGDHADQEIKLMTKFLGTGPRNSDRVTKSTYQRRHQSSFFNDRLGVPKSTLSRHQKLLDIRNGDNC